MSKKENKKEGPPFKIITEPVHAGSNGYMYVQTDPIHPKALKLSDRKARYVYEHRVVLENHLGRLLNDEEFEQVNHINGDKSDNILSNLELKVRGPHQHDHALSDNHFWENSPMNKKRSSENILIMAQRVLRAYFQN